MVIRRTFWAILLILAVCTTAFYFFPFEALQIADFRVVLLRVIYLCLLLILANWVWAWYSIRLFRFKRSARGFRQQLGQIFEERFEVHNLARFLRPWLTVHDESTLPGSGGSRVLSQIGPRELRNYSAYTLLTERGQFQLGPTTLSSGDPFGLFIIQEKIPADRSVLVLPYIVNIHSFPFPPGVLPGGKARRQKTPEVTPLAAGVREYAPGDPLNRIHWSSSARRDRLMVKEFEQDPRSDTWIFVDAFSGSHYGDTHKPVEDKIDQFWLWRNRKDAGLPDASFEYAVSIAASIAKFFVDSGQSVGVGSSGQVTIMQEPDRGERQLSKILESLALIQPVGKLPLLALVEGNFARIMRGSTAVLITAATDETVVTTVDSLLHRGVRPVIILLDPASFGGPESNRDNYLAIKARNAPVAIVECGNNIKHVLEHGFIGP